MFSISYYRAPLLGYYGAVPDALPINWDAAQFVLGVEYHSIERHSRVRQDIRCFILAGKVLALVFVPHTAQLLV